MERLNERLAVAARAAERLQQATGLPQLGEIERDAIIQRFGFTFEAVWKAAQAYLLQVEGIDAASPKGVIRACREVGLLDEVEATTALQMADDRNLTVHTYNEPLAVQIFGRIMRYQFLLAKWLEIMQERWAK
jgi:nucleotidyltransferase substrate binding protein (TIGR01987 family)